MMADIPSWQQSLEAPRFLVDPNRLVASLYECCLQIFSCFVKRPVPGLDSSIQRRLHTQAQKFKLWGVSFNAREGELDQKLVGAHRLKNALLPILSGMGETLVTLARRLNKAEELADTCSQFQLLKVQVSEVTTQSCPNDDDIFPQIALDELSSLESGDSSVDEMAKLEDLLRDTQSFNACLFGLSSVLEEPAEKAIPSVDDSQNLEGSMRELLKHSAWPYIMNIIEAYPSIDRTFARRLGEANELRYARLKAWRDRAQAGPIDTDSDDFSKEMVQPYAASKVPDQIGEIQESELIAYGMIADEISTIASESYWSGPDESNIERLTRAFLTIKEMTEMVSLSNSSRIISEDQQTSRIILKEQQGWCEALIDSQLRSRDSNKEQLLGQVAIYVDVLNHHVVGKGHVIPNESLTNPVVQESFSTIHRQFERMTHAGRHFCTTKAGRLGWASKRARQGDIVALLYGSVVPLLLRPRQDGKYECLEACYIHGIMDGELVEEEMLANGIPEDEMDDETKWKQYAPMERFVIV